MRVTKVATNTRFSSRLAFLQSLGNLRLLNIWRLFDWVRPGIAMIAGLMLAMAFPLPGWGAMAFVAPGMLLGSAVGLSGWRAFGIGYLGALVFRLTSLRWLLHIPDAWGAVAGWLALSLYSALFPAVWVWLCAPRISTKPGTSGPLSRLWTISPLPWSSRCRYGFLAAALWVAMEMLQARLLTGFPWNFLGVTQYKITPLIQVASTTGVYGISFLVAWISVSFMLAVAAIARKPGNPWTWLGDAIMPLAVLLTVCSFGFLRTTQQASQPENKIKMALIQPSIPQTVIFDSGKDGERVKTVMDLSRLALGTKPDLLIWPEASVPRIWDNYTAITNMVNLHKTAMILGADDFERRVGPDGKEEYDFFNSAFMIQSNGRLALPAYRKRQLVIFGEYIPFEKWLPFMKYLTPIPGSFTPGRAPVWFQLPGHRPTMAPLICFEDAFPHLCRQHVTEETGLMLNLTNDGWFSESAAQWQHMANAVFRAVENGVPLVRSSNNGITCWIDHQGRVHDIYGAPDGGVYGRGFALMTLPFQRLPGMTFYNRHGDFFGWACVGLGALAIFLCRRSVHSKKNKALTAA